jgi:hypothetical protein
MYAPLAALEHIRGGRANLPPCGHAVEIVASTGAEGGLPTGPVNLLPVPKALLDGVPRLGEGKLPVDGLQGRIGHDQALPKAGKCFDIIIDGAMQHVSGRVGVLPVTRSWTASIQQG